VIRLILIYVLLIWLWKEVIYHFGTKKDLEEHLKYKLELLRNK